MCNCLVILTEITVSSQAETIAFLKAGGDNVFSTFIFPTFGTISGIQRIILSNEKVHELIQMASQQLCAYPRCGGNIFCCF